MGIMFDNELFFVFQHFDSQGSAMAVFHVTMHKPTRLQEK